MSRASERAFVLAMQRRTATLTPEMRAAWVRAVRALLPTLGEDAIAQMIISGSIDSVLTEAVLNDALADMRREVLRSVQSGASTVSNALPPNAQLAFTTRANPRVLDAIRTLDDTILRDAKASIRETVRMAIEQGIRNTGQNPRAVARGIRKAVGLAPHQLEEVENYRQALLTSRKLGGAARPKALSYTLRDKRFDRTVLRARRSGTPLSDEYVERMVDAYRRKRIADHASTIARTATLNAHREGAHAAYLSSIENGSLDPARSFKVWVTVGDSRVRDEHKAMNGERVRYDETFSNGFSVPSEYNCRCMLRYVLEPLAPIARLA